MKLDATKALSCTRFQVLQDALVSGVIGNDQQKIFMGLRDPPFFSIGESGDDRPKGVDDTMVSLRASTTSPGSRWPVFHRSG